MRKEWLGIMGVVAAFVAFLCLMPLAAMFLPGVTMEGNPVELLKVFGFVGGFVLLIMATCLI